MSEPLKFLASRQEHAPGPDCWCCPISLAADGNVMVYHRDDLGRAYELGLDLVKAIQVLRP